MRVALNDVQLMKVSAGYKLLDCRRNVVQNVTRTILETVSAFSSPTGAIHGTAQAVLRQIAGVRAQRRHKKYRPILTYIDV